MLCKFLLKKKSQEWNYIHVNINFLKNRLIVKKAKQNKMSIYIRVPF